VAVIGRNFPQIFKTKSPALQNCASVKFPCKTGYALLLHKLKLRHIPGSTVTETQIIPSDTKFLLLFSKTTSENDHHQTFFYKALKKVKRFYLRNLSNIRIIKANTLHNFSTLFW